MARLAIPLSLGCALLLLMPSLHGQDSQSKKANDKSGKADVVIDLGNGVTMEFVKIKAGEFLMGSPDSDKEALVDEKPQHRVKITRDFYLGRYPVTQEQYQAVTGKNPSQFQGNIGKGVTSTRRFPVERVSWDNAVAFCSDLRERDKEKRRYGLPTEAEWEYAQRAGTTTRYFYGDDPDDLGAYAWFNGNSDQMTHEVGTKKPNPWGLYDMAGNVWQWCADHAPSMYKDGDVVDPKGPDSGMFRIMRGNQWGLIRRADSALINSRSASRTATRPGFMQSNIGFRVCIHLD
jgi:formylglycine-generating enzyme required for sulfatase activity